MENKIKVIKTNGIPQCPYCQKPTKRTQGMSTRTAMYFAPIYDENGYNTNPDRNNTMTDWQCLECMKKYTTSGNYIDGFHYVLTLEILPFKEKETK